VNFPYPVMVCDIGGTNVRFAVSAEPGAALGVVAFGKTAEHTGLEAALAAVLRNVSPPHSFIVCAAGPVAGRMLKLTNAAWTIDGAALADRFGFAQGLLFNDFEAQALSLPVLDAADWTAIGQPLAWRGGAQVVLGSGTGLGVGALVEAAGRFLALPSEAGHMNFDPATREEELLWRHIETDAIGRVSAEHLLSGAGLVRLHRARLRAAGREPGEIDDASEIAARARGERTSEEAQSIALFFKLLARFAGDLALAFLAHGGVTFSGGIFPKLVEFVDPAAFRAAFEAKAPHQGMMRQIATRLICNEASVLAGMAAVAHKPENYIIDYDSRAWRRAGG
jgi:glucokinase